MTSSETGFLLFKDFRDYVINDGDFFYFDVINVTMDSNHYLNKATALQIYLFTNKVPA